MNDGTTIFESIKELGKVCFWSELRSDGDHPGHLRSVLTTPPPPQHNIGSSAGETLISEPTPRGGRPLWEFPPYDVLHCSVHGKIYHRQDSGGRKTSDHFYIKTIARPETVHPPRSAGDLL